MFCTPALYSRFNDPRCNTDEEFFVNASDAWDAAVDASQADFDKIRGSLPRAAVRFTDLLCLHDARLVTVPAPGCFHVGAAGQPFALGVKQTNSVAKGNNYLCLIEYWLSDVVRLDVETGHGFNHDADPYWLYDEFSARADPLKGFVHELYCSNGLHYTIPFDEFRFTAGAIYHGSFAGLFKEFPEE